MDNNVAFSFVMPAYKGQFLYKAINSILSQTYQNFELIIINDASPYDIPGIINVFQDSRIRYKVNETNIGRKDLVSNWNHCIKFARNEYIILATDDDMFEPTFLEKASTLIKKYPSSLLRGSLDDSSSEELSRVLIEKGLLKEGKRIPHYQNYLF